MPVLARGKLVFLTGNTRITVIALVVITFVGSMLIANDMALITFLPLGYIALKETEQEKYICFTFIMQNIATNLGGMLTPFGNPQNLYLYTKFDIPNGEFVSIMLPPFCVSVLLITLCCLIFVKSEPLQIEEKAAALAKIEDIRAKIADGRMNETAFIWHIQNEYPTDTVNDEKGY